MTDWLSKTLFRRMISTLLLGLVLAQVLNDAIHEYQHYLLSDQANQIHTAKRVADLVKLILALPAETKQHLAKELRSDATLHLQLAKKMPPSNRTGEPNNPAFKLFRHTLNALLGKQMPKRVIATETSPHHVLFQIDLVDGNTIILQTDWSHGAEYEPSLLVRLGIILAAIMGFSFVAVRWVTHPLQQLANAAEELGNDINRPPLDENSPLEVSRAAHAFNVMQQRLRRHIQDRTQLLAAISHDLKTPITRLRLRTELLDNPNMRSRFQKDLDEMEKLVIATLDFMRGVDQQEPMQLIDIMALLESLQADAQEMKQTVTIHGSTQSPYRGKPSALKRCLNNLLDNAFKYGHSATLFVEDSETCCVIRILDEGPGIPQEHLETVFTPYYRLESSRNRDTGGTGLGLSIAQDIAHLHGGHLSLHNKASGGLEAILALPRNNFPHH